MKRRSSGLLMHISSLPSSFGIGDFGPEAYRFADFLTASGQSFWQVLPLNPTITVCGNSPYSSFSAFALNPLFISPELMVQDGYLSGKDIITETVFPNDRVDYDAVTEYKTALLNKAYINFKKIKNKYEFLNFCSENSFWLDDFAVFSALKKHFKGSTWNNWPYEIRERNKDALKEIKGLLCEKIEFEKFIQYVAAFQWMKLKEYCNGKGIQIIGDIPIYLQHDSADIWTNPIIVKLDNDKKPYAVAGVPPDYFSSTGQLWGNPVYNWEYLKSTGFEWWIKRIKYVLNLYNIIRIDHFRGFVSYWEVPAWEKTAVNGKWVEVPCESFFNTLLKNFPVLPVIAEDLGVITADVREALKENDFPGMKVLVFAFGGNTATNPYIPHNVPKESIFYTGTHDTNTVRGWFENEATPEIKKNLFDYLGRKTDSKNVHLEFIRLVMMSVADVAVFPVQDILGLGADKRMNFPSVCYGNWSWRLKTGQLTNKISGFLLKMTTTYGRNR